MSRAPEPVEWAARDRAQRIASHREPGPGAVGWVPDMPPEIDAAPDDLPDPYLPDDDVPDEHDVRDVVARMRAGALDAAAAAYTAAHGHPLDHLAGPGPRRWHLSVRLAVVAGIATAVLGAGVAARATLAAPTAPAVAAPTRSAGATSAVTAAVAAGTGSGAVPGQVRVPEGSASPTAGTVVVHVVGQVMAPGLVWLPAGSRVSDAVAAAGGATPGANLAAVNLARVVGDGEQIVVPAPVPGAAPGAVAGPATGAGAPSGPVPLVDLNSADLAALDALPGIGPVLAQRILDWRGKHGRFSDVAELGEVAGIGDKLLGQLRDLVRI